MSRMDFYISNSVSDRILSSMENAFVGRFLSFRPTVDMVRKWVALKWRLKGSVEIYAMSGGIFLFKFTMPEDLVSVLSTGPWVYGKHNLALCHWKPRFNSDLYLNKSAPVWNCLPGLPLEY